MNRKQLGQTRITNAKDSRKTVTNSQIGLHFLEHGADVHPAEVDDEACFFDGCVVVLSDVVDLRFPRGKATGSDIVT